MQYLLGVSSTERTAAESVRQRESWFQTPGVQHRACLQPCTPQDLNRPRQSSG